MKNFLLSLTVIAGFSLANAQAVLFEDDFESYEDFAIDGIGDWIMIDVDGAGTYSGGGGEFPNQFDPKAFMVFNPLEAGVQNSDGGGGEEFRDFDPHSGDKYMGAWASVDVPNNDWMISPPITLAASGNMLEFYVKSLSDTYGLEEFNYWIYVGSDIPTPDDFNWYGMDIAPAGEWMLITEDLSNVAGETIRIGIQCTSNDAYMLMVDDVRVVADGLGISEVGVQKDTAIYPNPVIDTFSLNLSAGYDLNKVQVAVYDVTGKLVKSFGSASTYNVSDLAAGVYIVRINDGRHTITKKIVKK